MFQYIRTAKETQLGKMAAARDGGWGLGGQSSECVGKEDYFVSTVPEMVSSVVRFSKQTQRRLLRRWSPHAREALTADTEGCLLAELQPRMSSQRDALVICRMYSFQLCASLEGNSLEGVLA
jgi:hypothetical protein